MSEQALPDKNILEGNLIDIDDPLVVGVDKVFDAIIGNMLAKHRINHSALDSHTPAEESWTSGVVASQKGAGTAKEALVRCLQDFYDRELLAVRPVMEPDKPWAFEPFPTDSDHVQQAQRMLTRYHIAEDAERAKHMLKDLQTELHQAIIEGPEAYVARSEPSAGAQVAM